MENDYGSGVRIFTPKIDKEEQREYELNEERYKKECVDIFNKWLKNSDSKYIYDSDKPKTVRRFVKKSNR